MVEQTFLPYKVKLIAIHNGLFYTIQSNIYLGFDIELKQLNRVWYFEIERKNSR